VPDTAVSPRRTLPAMHMDLLASLPDDQRRLVAAKMIRRSYRKGDTLLFEGDVGDSLHIVTKGKIAIRTSTLKGDVVTFTVLGEGAAFGELALLEPGSRRSASAVALEPAETSMLHRSDFDDLRQRFPAVERFLVELLAAKVRRLSTQVQEALYVPADTRVVRRLADMTELYAGAAADGHVDLPVRQEDLASMAGTTRPTTNRVLKQLQDEGIVILARGRTVVVDRAALQRRAR
jgi:CRP/FNR family cyclic AMP-dependent transcriptional regulator